MEFATFFSDEKEKKATKTVTTPIVEESKEKQYIYMRSNLCNDNFVLCLDKSVYHEVLEKYPDTVLFFSPEIQELEIMMYSFKNQEEFDKFVKGIFLLKKHLKCWIVPRKVK